METNESEERPVSPKKKANHVAVSEAQTSEHSESNNNVQYLPNSPHLNGIGTGIAPTRENRRVLNFPNQSISDAASCAIDDVASCAVDDDRNVSLKVQEEEVSSSENVTCTIKNNQVNVEEGICDSPSSNKH